MNFPFSIKLIKFGITGVIGMMIDFSVTWLFKEKLKQNKYLSNTLGFTCAVVNNFLINRYWTFQQSQQALPGQFTKFLIVSITGLIINNLLLYVFVNFAKKNFYLSKVIVIGIVFFWNYFANYLYTFK